jgi:hypothetical protein
MDFSPLTYAAITAIFVAGAAWGAVKHSLNGTKTKVEEIQSRLYLHIKDESDADQKTHERIARVETKVDFLVERVK